MSQCALLALAICLAHTTHAQPVVDSVCGTTITADLILERDIDCTGFVGNALTIGASNVTIHGNGFRLLAPDSARAISITGGHLNSTVRDLAIIGWCTGVGIYIDGGSGHVIDNVDATGRSIGADIRNTSNLTIHNLKSDSAATVGLDLRSVALPIQLSGLVLTNNNIGLRMNTISGPLLLDTAAIADIRGNATSVEYTASVSHVTLKDLVLDGSTTGLLATAITNANNTLVGVDLSHTTGLGVGATLGGPGHRLERVTANRRATGVSASATTDLHIDDFTASGCITTGLLLATVNGTPFFRRLTLEDNTTAFSLTTFGPDNRFTLDAYDAISNNGTFASLADSDTALVLSNVQNTRVANLTLDNDTTAINANATNNANIIFENLNLSGRFTGGTGLHLNGADHVVRHVVANRRGTGVHANNTNKLALTDITATGCSEGVRLASLNGSYTPPVLARLTLSDNTVGLMMAGVATPLTFSPATALDVSRSVTGITITSGGTPNLTSRAISFQNLTLSNPEYGINAGTGTNENLVFSNIDFSGPMRGIGLALGGPGHVLEGLSAIGRDTGFELTATSGISITDLSANHCGTGLTFVSLNPTHLHPDVEGMDLRYNNLAIYFNTVNHPVLVDAGWFLDVTGSATGISLYQSRFLSFHDLVLPNQNYGFIATGPVTESLTFIGVDASSMGTAGHVNTLRGDGISIVGPNHTLTNVTTHRRRYGVNATSADNLAVTNLKSNDCTTSGLAISGIAVGGIAPKLSQLELRNNYYGLSLNSSHSPLTLGATTAIDVSGSSIGIYGEYLTDFTVRDMALPNNRTFAIDIRYHSTRLLLENLDVSGDGVGTGINLGNLSTNSTAHYAGHNHIIRNVTARHRNQGVNAVAASNLLIDGLTATQCGRGLHLEAFRFNGTTAPGPFVQPTLRALNLGDNAVGLSMVGHKPTTPLVIDGYDALSHTGVIATVEGSDVGIVLSDTSNLTLRNFSLLNSATAATSVGIAVGASSDITFSNLVLRSYGAGIRATTGNSRLRFENLDVSGDGTGYGIHIGIAVSSPGNYGGPDHVIRDITARNRTFGIQTFGTSGLVVDGLTATNNRTAGLDISGYATGFVSPSLSRLTLDDNGTGLWLRTVSGTALAPYTIGPSTFDSLARNGTSLVVTTSTDVRIHGLTLDGPAYGLDASGTAIRVENVDVTGPGHGVGVRMSGSDHVLDGVVANLRTTGLFMSVTTNPVLRNITASRNSASGIQFTTTTLPVTVENLQIAQNRTGLAMSTINGTGSLLLDAGTIGTLAGSQTGISLAGAGIANVTVDTAGLGLIQSGNTYNLPAPVPDSICGTTLTSDLILTSDIHCPGILSPLNALNIGADGVTIDGGPNRYRIIAPSAAAVVRALNFNRVTVRNLDVSGTWTTGDGIVIDGGTGHVISNVSADYRGRGMHLRNASDTSTSNFSATGSLTAGLHLETLARPLHLSNLALTNGATQGLYWSGFNGTDPDTGAPFVVDGSVLGNVNGNATSVYLLNNMSGVHFRGPISGLNGGTYAIRADNITNNALSFTDLDLTPLRSGGFGLALFGSNHAVSGCTVRRRATAFDLRSGTGLRVDNLVIEDADTVGLSLDAVFPVALTRIDISRSAIAWDLKNLVDANLTIGPWSLVTPAGAVARLSNNATDVRISGSSRISVSDLTLSGWSSGVTASAAGNGRLTFTALDILRSRPWSANAGFAAAVTGLALNVAGPNHVLNDIDIEHHAIGISASNVTNLAMNRIAIDDTPTTAIALATVTLPLSLTNLSLTRAGTALSITALAGTSSEPFVLRPYSAPTGAIATTAMSGTGLFLSNVQHAVIEDLTFDNVNIGISANAATNANLTLRRLNVSGSASGTGLSLAGTSHTIHDVTANHRATGLSILGGGHDIRRITSRHVTGTALALNTMDPPPTLVDLRLGESNACLALTAIAGTSTTPVAIGAHSATSPTGAIATIDGCYQGIVASNIQHLRFDGLNLDSTFVGFTGNVSSNRNLTFSHLDLTTMRYGGTGILVAGPNHQVADTTIRRRGNGLQFVQASNIRVERLSAPRNQYPLLLQNVPNEPATYAPPYLRDLDLRESLAAVYLDGWALPFTFDTAMAIDFRGSKTGIHMTRGSSGWAFPANITIRGLQNFQVPPYATNMGALTITAPAIMVPVASENLVLEDLDLSGPGLGTGLHLVSPTDVTIRNVTANNLAVGAYITNPNRGHVENLVARYNQRGLMLWYGNATRTAPTIAGLVLSDNSIALNYNQWYTPMTLGSSTGLDVRRSLNGIWGYDTQSVTFADLTLDNVRRGVSLMDSSGNPLTNDLTFRGLNVSGRGRGVGLELRGPRHVIEDVVANDRQYGVSVLNGSALEISRFQANAASDAALFVNGLPLGSAAPNFTDLSLTGSQNGLRLDNIRVPVTISGDRFTSLAANLTPIQLAGTNNDVTFRDLTLPSSVTGILASAGTTNTNIRLENVDVTGYCRGTGLSIAGNDNFVTGLIAARRATGISQGAGDRLTITDSVVGANTTGLSIGGSSFIVNTSVIADATNTATRFRVGTQTNMFAGQTLRVNMPDGAEDRVVSTFSNNFVTFTTALSAIPPAGTTVRALNFGDPRLTLVASDICANGTGAAFASHPVTAADNYWRSSTGPRHTTLNPSGGGDLVTSTNTATVISPWNPVPTDKDNHYCNQAPSPDAGPDQTGICEGDVVTLDATASLDPDIEPLTFFWTQRAGPLVQINNVDSAIATFVAPAPSGGADAETLVFRVRVDDGHLWRTDDMQVTVIKGNAFPTAVPGVDRTVAEGDTVALDASSSFDPENQALTHLWEQVSGPTGVLLDADTATPSFTAPTLDVGGGPDVAEVVLRLTVTDTSLPEHCGGPRTHSATVTISVENRNQSPTADAGPDLAVFDNAAVTLDGTSSSDPDGDMLLFNWVQVSGATVTLGGADTPAPAFTTPAAPAPGTEVLVFQLTVEDGFGGTDTTTVTVTITTDACPDDPDKIVPGVCGCGVSDLDSDGDGTADCIDACPDDPDKIIAGACGCGGADTDTDGDGTADCVDGCPSDIGKTAPGLCGCGVADDDSDADGVADCLDSCMEDPTKVDPGDCGCGVPDLDTDSDGAADCIDLCPDDPLKIAPGQCGCGTSDIDSSGSGIADCLSDCADLADGTIVQANVPCGDGMCGAATGTEYCEDGLLVSTCDEAWEQIPDIVCGADQPVVAYAIAMDANGTPVGTIRCVQTSVGVVACDTDPEAPRPGTLKIHAGLFCPGEAIP